jgi:thioredoxin 2
VADVALCGVCKSSLPPAGQPIAVDEGLFDAIVSGTNVPVMVDFWADWCGPCRTAAPEVERLAQEMAGQAVVLKVDIEANPGLANRYGVQSIPNFVVFRGGQPVFQRAGAAPRAEMKRWIEGQ